VGLEIDGDVRFLSLSSPLSKAESIKDIVVVLVRLLEVTETPQEGRIE